MATVTLRIDDVLRDRLQEVADSRGVTMSNLIRSAVDEMFDHGDRNAERRSVVPESISPIDRKQLALLHRILARLVAERADDERLGEDGDTSYQLDRATALEGGWALEYNMEFIAMETELSRRECGLVLDVFDMFRVLRHSLDALEEEMHDSVVQRLTFAGYDQNDPLESRLLGYARWIVGDGKRWQEQTDVFSYENDLGNSHVPTLAGYERMLEVYEPIWRSVVRRGGREKNVLTAEELRRVADAAVHPSTRAGRWQ